jgi:hypothetical protein
MILVRFLGGEGFLDLLVGLGFFGSIGMDGSHRVASLSNPNDLFGLKIASDLKSKKKNPRTNTKILTIPCFSLRTCTLICRHRHNQHMQQLDVRW